MEEDCQKINDALKAGEKPDLNALIEITTSKKGKERAGIPAAYETKFGVALFKDFEEKLSGDLLEFMKILYTDPSDYPVDEVYEALQKTNTDEETLIKVLCTRPSSLLKKLATRYNEKYQQDLVEKIKKECKSDFRDLLVLLLTTERSANKSPDEESCKKIAQELYDNGENKLGTNEEVFLKYFSQLSGPELMIVAREYHKISGKMTLYQVIDSEFSSDIKNALQTIMFCHITPAQYFANEVLTAIKGAGTNEKNLYRVLVTRSESDMDKIKQYFKQINNKDMGDEILDDLSGAYGKLAMYLIGEKEKGDSLEVK